MRWCCRRATFWISAVISTNIVALWTPEAVLSGPELSNVRWYGSRIRLQTVVPGSSCITSQSGQRENAELPVLALPLLAKQLRLRGGGRYVTRADYIKAGTEYDEYNYLQDDGKVWQSWKFIPEQEMGHGQLVPVLGIEHDGTFDNETTSLMQIRLALERTDFNSLRIAMHNAAELDIWTDRLDRAFNIGEKALSTLLRKVDYREMVDWTEERGTHMRLAEDKLGLRAPIPPKLQQTQRTHADILLGPRDGSTRLRIDQNLTMEENYALWDALESEWLRKRELPEVQSLRFEDPFLEAVYKEKAEGPVLSWPNVELKWEALKRMATERAEEALRDGECGEVGSAWYRAAPPANDTAEAHPEGAWWFMNGEVRRLPGLFWCNGRFTAHPEPFDAEQLLEEGCPHCPWSDCLHPKRVIRRHRRVQTFRAAGPPTPDPLHVARLGALGEAERELQLLGAAKQGDLPLLEALVQAGARVDCRDAKGGNTPLHWAARYGYEEVVERLSQLGADANARSNAGATPLHFAAHFGKTLVCEALVRRCGAEVNAECDLKWTALMEAAEQKHNFTCSKLLQLGADPWLRNHQNDTALNLAEGGYCAVISMLLRKAMGLRLCECFGCAGYSAGYNNMLAPHITDAQTHADWDRNFDPADFYNTTFEEEMRKGAEEIEELERQEELKGPMAQIDPVTREWEKVKGGEWWFKMAKEKLDQFYADYDQAFGGDTQEAPPAAEALDVYEMLQRREQEEHNRKRPQPEPP